jgi:hypothetical protein
VSWGYKPSWWYKVALVVFGLPGLVAHLFGYGWGFYLFGAAVFFGAVDAFLWSTRKTGNGN